MIEGEQPLRGEKQDGDETQPVQIRSKGISPEQDRNYTQSLEAQKNRHGKEGKTVMNVQVYIQIVLCKGASQPGKKDISWIENTGLKLPDEVSATKTREIPQRRFK